MKSISHNPITIEDSTVVGIDPATTENLLNLLTLSRSASETYTEAVTGVAERTGIRKPIVRAYVKALFDSEREQVSADAEQLQELLSRAP